MNISTVISLLRNTIKKFTDDSIYEDEFLYNVALLFRNKYTSQRFKKYYNISEELMKDYCTPTEIANSHDCDCVEVGCKVVKTVYSIPSTLTGRYRDMFKVYTLDYKSIPRVTPDEQKSNQLDEITAGEISYSLLNRKVVLWNTNLDKPLKGIIISGIWEDETEWDGKTLCDYLSDEDTTSYDNCFNLEETKFAIDADLLSYVIQESIQHLGISLQLIQDNTNDANDDIKA